MLPGGGRAAAGARVDRVVWAVRHGWTVMCAMCVCVEAGMAGVQAGMSSAGSALLGEAGTVVTPSACDGVAAEKYSAAVPLQLECERLGLMMCVGMGWQGGSMGVGMPGPFCGHGSMWPRGRAQAGSQAGPSGPGTGRCWRVFCV